MNASLILANLNIIDKIYRFFLFLEIKFQEDLAKNEDIKSIRLIISSLMLEIAVDIEARFQQEISQFNPKNNIEDALQIAKSISFEVGQVENFSLLLSDLKNVSEFIGEYQANSSQIFSNDNFTRSRELKEKVLLIISERFA